MAGMGSTAGAVAGQIASTAIYTAANASANIKPKDELTLDIKLQNGETVAVTKQFKAKAKSAGEDIISPIVEQAATALVETIGK
jgi:outer membrane lipoprotein SlyB